LSSKLSLKDYTSSKYQKVLKPTKKAKTTEATMIQTVEENKIWYTPQQIERANLARKLYHVIGSPSIEAFKGILRDLIKNCPVTIADVDIAERICGPSISMLKGKTTQQTP